MKLPSYKILSYYNRYLGRKIKKIYAGKLSFAFRKLSDYLYHDVPTMSLATVNDTLCLSWNFELDWCENIRQNRYWFMFFVLTSNHRNTAHGIFFKFRYHCRSCCHMFWEKMQTVILIILYTEGLNQVMNHHPKILILPMNHEGTISTLLLLVKHHHSFKEKLCLRITAGTSY